MKSKEELEKLRNAAIKELLSTYKSENLTAKAVNDLDMNLRNEARLLVDAKNEKGLQSKDLIEMMRKLQNPAVNAYIEAMRSNFHDIHQQTKENRSDNRAGVGTRITRRRVDTQKNESNYSIEERADAIKTIKSLVKILVDAQFDGTNDMPRFARLNDDVKQKISKLSERDPSLQAVANKYEDELRKVKVDELETKLSNKFS